MNRRSIFTTALAAATAVAVLGISAASSASDHLTRHPNDNSDVATYVRNNYLDVTGLSPASMRPASDPYTTDREAIARFAVENGLSGLSPASLRPVDD